MAFLGDQVPPHSVIPVEYYSTTDPALDVNNHVAKGKQWLKTDNLGTPTWFELYRRNEANSAWVLMRAWVNEAPYAEGDIFYINADGRLIALPAGDDGDVLTLASGIPSWSAAAGGSTVAIEDEGSAEGDADTIDFVGAGVSVTFAAGQATVTIPGGGLTQAYAGYNTIGGSWETFGTGRVYAKSVTLANDCLMTSIGAHVRNQATVSDDQVENLAVALYTDNAGAPDLLVGYGGGNGTLILLDNTPGDGGDGVGRWLEVPLGKWLVAGTYWIAVACLDAASILQIAHDGSGADRHYTSSASPGWFADWGFYTPTTTSNQYSIRANTIR